MPIAKIEVRRARTPEEVEALIEALYLAEREALEIPEWDHQIRYIEHKPEHFAVPLGRSENFTFVEILLFYPRSIDAKRNLYQATTRRFGALGIAPIDIVIALQERPMENWGGRGLPASEAELVPRPVL